MRHPAAAAAAATFATVLILLILLLGSTNGQISSLDTNQDGHVTKEEETKFLETLHGNLDKNSDGSISGQELFGVCTSN